MTWTAQISVFLYGLVMAALVLRILTRHKPVGVTLAWLLLIVAVPVAGFGLYLLFGERYIGFLRASRAKEMYQFYGQWVQRLSDHGSVHGAHPDALAKPLWDQTYGAIRLPAFNHNELTLLELPDEILANILSDIEHSQTSVFMEFYILDLGGQVETILTALEAAHDRGVDVRLILDSVGSRSFLRSSRRKELESRGIKIVQALFANPFRLLMRRIDIRMH